MKWLSECMGRQMITIRLQDEDDVRSLFEIMMEMRQYLDCLSGECECASRDDDEHSMC